MRHLCNIHLAKSIVTSIDRTTTILLRWVRSCPKLEWSRSKGRQVLLRVQLTDIIDSHAARSQWTMGHWSFYYGFLVCLTSASRKFKNISVTFSKRTASPSSSTRDKCSLATLNDQTIRLGSKWDLPLKRKVGGTRYEARSWGAHLPTPWLFWACKTPWWEPSTAWTCLDLSRFCKKKYRYFKWCYAMRCWSSDITIHHDQ